MENGGYTAVNVFRKHYAENSKKSKYTTQTISAEELASGEKKSFFETDFVKKTVASESDDDMGVDELMKMTKKMKITPKKKPVKQDVDMEAPKV